DACDSFRTKVEAVAWCRRRKQPVLTVGSVGGRTDPTLVRVRDLSRTEHDAMLALVRKKLRAGFGFPRNPDRFFGVPAVYSLENVKYPQADGSVSGVRPKLGAEAALKLDCGSGLGAATHITGAFAFAAAGKALEMLLKGRPAPAPGSTVLACAAGSAGGRANKRWALAVVAAAIAAGSSSRRAAMMSSIVRSRAGSLRWPRLPASGWSGASVSSSRNSSGMPATSRRRRCARS